ncbi:hypothetical protein [Selenomonas ruminantium]|uniref:hypothetical protein n=1 Tax=Selenomonas ruminantium TaxID=971 RepID=UPI0026EFE06A|nr:hypothetical protein [Selenomonas ruminantium]
MKKIESGINFEGYTFEIGNKYIHAKSAELGKKNEKQLLTPAGKEQAKWIAENTEYGTIQRHNLMGRIWHDPYYSKEI